MRGYLLIVLMIVLTTISLAQDLDGWRGVIVEEYSEKSSKSDEIFLVEATRSSIRSSGDGIEILKTFDENHYIVKGIPSQIMGRIWSVDSDWKLDIEEKASHSLHYVLVADSFNKSEFAGLKVIKSYPPKNIFLIQGKTDLVKELLLDDPNIYHITNKVYRPFVESRVIDMNLNPNRVNRIHHSFPELDGSTETVSIQENYFDIDDIDLLNRSLVSGLESEFVDNHATEMATIIAGKGNSFITGRGVASDLTIISSDFLEPMPDPDQHYLNFGINTQNHSYGIVRENEYGIEARAFDQSVNENPNLLHVFSSGNQGAEVSTDGAYVDIEGYANLTGNIKMSKNSLVVGSVDTVGSIPAFVSRGPAYDGRVKPEVVAYSVVGSSNSAALVSGVSALLQQQYRIDNASDMPAALVKALLINNARDVGSEGLDFLTGYGNIDAWRSMQALRNTQFASGAVSDGETVSFDLGIPADAVNLKVTLCWTDLPANVNDAKALVNDLNLRVVDGATVVLPWVLDASPNVNSLSKAAVRGVDDLNNVEQVTITSPGTNYTVEVEGEEVTGDQTYFITWQYETDDTFEWDFPTGSDNMPYNGESGSYFRWNTTKVGTGALSYSADDVNWITLDSNIDLSDEYWRWNNAPFLGDDVRARMEIDGEFFETDLFTLSEPLTTSVGFNCGDSLLLKWHPVTDAMDYTILTLGTESLDNFETTTDTFFVVSNVNELPTNRFSVRPNLPSGKSLLPAPTFDYTLQGVGCYVFSFFQTVALDTGIHLNLTLGTTYGIDRIEFERNDFINGFQQIGSITTFDGEEYSFLDENPSQGFNEHRAIIYFINGEELVFSAGTSFYLTEEPIRIFPNPIQPGEDFSILTREFEDRTPLIEFIDQKGALVFSKEVQGSQDFISTTNFQSGVYFYRLYADGEVYTGLVSIR
ncbi:S8 family serine peptidase [Ekhidna sp.]